MYVIIKDDSGFCVELDEDFDSVTLDCSYELLQPKQIGEYIAYKLMDADAEIYDDCLENEIVGYLDDLMTKIKDSANNVFDENGIRVGVR